MNIQNRIENIEYKKLLFEYIVSLLCNWQKQLPSNSDSDFTKLRLQKILFLISAWKTDINNKGLLNIFDRFAALPYGPVELDIYDSMCGNSPFSNIKFEGNCCKTESLENADFSSLKSNDKILAEEAISTFIQGKKNYLTCPVFDLVDITHQWTVWQVSMSIAELSGSKKEEMSTDDICSSSIKTF